MVQTSAKFFYAKDLLYKSVFIRLPLSIVLKLQQHKVIKGIVEPYVTKKIGYVTLFYIMIFDK